MAAKIIRLFSLLLIVTILGGCAKNQENTVIVETENGKEVALKNFNFGLKEITKQGTIKASSKASDGSVYEEISGQEYLFYPQNEIPFKPGAAFGATWFVPPLDKQDLIILKIQLELSPLPESKNQKVIISSINKRITSFIRGPDYFDLTLEADDPLGDYKISIFNRGKMIASNVFHVRK